VCLIVCNLETLDRGGLGPIWPVERFHFRFRINSIDYYDRCKYRRDEVFKIVAIKNRGTLKKEFANPSGRTVSGVGPTAVRLLGLRVRFPLGAWMSVSCECCVLSDRGFCDGPITRPEESYRVWCVQLNVIQEPHRGGLSPLGLSNHEINKGM
jgi:hypothetical protein